MRRSDPARNVVNHLISIVHLCPLLTVSLLLFSIQLAKSSEVGMKASDYTVRKVFYRIKHAVYRFLHPNSRSIFSSLSLSHY